MKVNYVELKDKIKITSDNNVIDVLHLGLTVRFSMMSITCTWKWVSDSTSRADAFACKFLVWKKLWGTGFMFVCENLNLMLAQVYFFSLTKYT